MSRQRPIDRLDTPVNPCYLNKWYGAVSVKDVIDAAFDVAWDRAETLAARTGQVSIVAEPWQDVSPEVHHYLNLKLQCLDILASEHSRRYESSIKLNVDCSKVVEIRQSTFHNGLKGKNVIDIPTHWHDSEPDWTWQDVCKNGQYYSTSSTEIWPRPKYKQRAMKEAHLQLTEERRQLYLSYYSKRETNLRK